MTGETGSAPAERPAAGGSAGGASGDLPVARVLPDLRASVAAGEPVLLAAPPGSGKTSLVPLALHEATRRSGGRVVVLEPRRVAARAAARRMASLLGERVGGTVGLRMRMDVRVGPTTAIEVVTEGVFTRMVADDPMLAGVAAVVLDEFHERSLEADLALALALESRAAFRPDLGLVVMSATLDVARVRRVLPAAPLIEAEGRVFPVETRHVPPPPHASRVDAVVAAVRDVLAREPGSVLAFLPSRAEVETAARRIAEAAPAGVAVHPLHGGLPGDAQDRAIAPAPAGARKVVVATAIAETAITIEGVRVVVDCGFARRAVHDSEAGLTRLETVRVSQAAAEQRRGRAGRTEPGLCVRLWPEGQTRAFLPHDPPEILEADLTGLALSLHAEGIRDPAALAFVDPPPEAGWRAAVERLARLGAIDGDARITPTGRALAALPLDPPLAAIVLAAARAGAAREGALLAAVAADPALRAAGPDAAASVRALANARGGTKGAAARMAGRWARLAVERVAGESDAAAGAGASESGPLSAERLGLFAARGMPERIAQARGGPGRYRLASGRGAALDPADPLAAHPFLVALDVQGGAREPRILHALPLDKATLLAEAPELVESLAETAFDEARGAVVERKGRRIGAVVLEETVRQAAPGAAATAALAGAIARRGLAALSPGPEVRALLARLRFAAGELPGEDADALSDAALARTAADWLLPFAPGAVALADIGPRALCDGLEALAAAHVPGGLDAVAPARLALGDGRFLAIDYASGEPVARARVQDLFGLARHPELPSGVPVVLELLSPADRPIQVTRDLPAFWAGTWAEVRRDLRGRYPKHHWPERPESAPPVRLGREARDRA